VNVSRVFPVSLLKKKNKRREEGDLMFEDSQNVWLQYKRFIAALNFYWH